MPEACLDANLVLAWLLPTQSSEAADSAHRELLEGRFTLNAPPLLFVEVPSVIRARIYSQRLSPELGQAAFDAFCDLGIESLRDHNLHLRAWSLARDLNFTKLYDAQYLATAEILECDLWTMDKRLVRSVDGRFRRLRIIE
jgi:predicted nucleic acid-binding protein